MRLWLLAPLFLTGCASFVAKVIPVGEPVTKERCEKMDTFKLGENDGLVGLRAGDKFDFWKKDCAAFGVKLDYQAYLAGHAKGKADFCSCHRGFVAGVHQGYLEAQKQDYLCSPTDKQEFIRGIEIGKFYSDDPNLILSRNSVETKYHDDRALSEGLKICPLTKGSPGGGPIEKIQDISL